MAAVEEIQRKERRENEAAHWKRQENAMDQNEEAARVRIERLKFLFSHANQLQQETATFEHAALRPLFVMNGGALAAMVAYLGSNASERVDLSLVLLAIASWAIGLLCGALAASLGYLSQLTFYKATGRDLHAELTRGDKDTERFERHIAQHDEFAKKAVSYRNWAHGLGGGSLVLFLAGIFWSIVAFIEVAKN